ncbi:MAG TPA: DNA-binding response regulator [Gemmatimonas aurantiaca]|uniref:OmpR family two-component response regulator n=2 Tax=Gemmatimonas aurantiaca TaxID=173480 RepID=C1A710_GEMAT|nr:OmpR family two-component response regulator [Gemmatimonas aurantiaca T-27]HCT56794.1 DNA-binding response regulator [Gemmatimonas aurantiaca]
MAVVSDSTAAVGQVRAFEPHLVILDLMMPGLDGFSVLERLRADGFGVPVLILSARSEEADKVRGFRSGADDFVTKPFGVLELVERVSALLRRTRSASPPDDESTLPAFVRFSDVVVDVAARRVSRADEAVPLTPKEFDLLLALVRQPEKALARATLLRDVWGHAPDIQTRTVDLHVVELRRKLERIPSRPRHIRTVWKTGYRFDP